MDHEQATLINRDTPEPLPKDGLSLFFAKVQPSRVFEEELMPNFLTLPYSGASSC